MSFSCELFRNRWKKKVKFCEENLEKKKVFQVKNVRWKVFKFQFEFPERRLIAKCLNIKCSTSTWKLLESHCDSCCLTATFHSRMSESHVKNGLHWSQVSRNVNDGFEKKVHKNVTSQTWLKVGDGRRDNTGKIREDTWKFAKKQLEKLRNYFSRNDSKNFYSSFKVNHSKSSKTSLHKIRNNLFKHNLHTFKYVTSLQCLKLVP